MPRGAAPGERRGGGRKPGQKNRATLERELLRKREEEARQAQIDLQVAKAANKKMAKEVLEDYMFLFSGIAATHQPFPPGQPKNANDNPEKFEKFARLAVETAKELAKYQSPQFRAIIVAPAPDANKGEQRKRFTLTIFQGRQPQMLEGPKEPEKPEDPEEPDDDVKH